MFYILLFFYFKIYFENLYHLIISIIILIIFSIFIFKSLLKWIKSYKTLIFLSDPLFELIYWDKIQLQDYPLNVRFANIIFSKKEKKLEISYFFIYKYLSCIKRFHFWKNSFKIIKIFLFFILFKWKLSFWNNILFVLQLQLC